MRIPYNIYELKEKAIDTWSYEEDEDDKPDDTEIRTILSLCQGGRWYDGQLA